MVLVTVVMLAVALMVVVVLVGWLVVMVGHAEGNGP